MNVHYLELFYYVAKYEGITPAVRKMPYGIQQPAVSAQLLKLEDELNVKLFHRRPFGLTNPGQRLYHFIEPFFSRLPQMASDLRGENKHHLCLGASQTVLAHYLPILLRELREEIPDLKLTLEQLSPADAEAQLLEEKIDLAVTILHGKAAPGIKTIELVTTPLVLLAHVDDPVKDFDELKEQAVKKKLDLPLVSLPEEEILSQLFHKALGKQGFSWIPRLTVNQMELVQSYVAEGFGYGIYAEVPGLKVRKNVKKIPLPDFPTITVGCLHRGFLNPVATRFVEGAQALASTVQRLSG